MKSTYPVKRTLLVKTLGIDTMVSAAATTMEVGEWRMPNRAFSVRTSKRRTDCYYPRNQELHEHDVTDRCLRHGCIRCASFALLRRNNNVIVSTALPKSLGHEREEENRENGEDERAHQTGDMSILLHH